MKDYQEQGKPLIVLDLPLLFEMNYESLCDDIIVVAVSVETQISRMEKKRNGYTRQEALERIQSQMPLEEKKVKRATIVWSNEGTLQELEQKKSISSYSKISLKNDIINRISTKKEEVFAMQCPKCKTMVLA